MHTPIYLSSYLEMSKEKNSVDDYQIWGALKCCGKSMFRLTHHGQELNSENGVALCAQCLQCGRNFRIFDDELDGYDNCCDAFKKTRKIKHEQISMACKRCGRNSYSVKLFYEYPSFMELEELGIQEKDNCFTWISVSIRCNYCHKAYRNIIECETG